MQFYSATALQADGMSKSSGSLQARVGGKNRPIWLWTTSIWKRTKAWGPSMEVKNRKIDSCRCFQSIVKKKSTGHDLFGQDILCTCAYNHKKVVIYEINTITLILSSLSQLSLANISMLYCSGTNNCRLYSTTGIKTSYP